MAKKIGKADVNKEVEEQIRSMNLLIDLQKKEYEGLTHVFNLESQRSKILLEVQKAENERNVRFAEYTKLQEAAAAGQVSVSKTTLTSLEKQLKKEQDKIVKLKTQEKIMRAMSNIKFPDIMGELSSISKLFDDKPIRETALQLGLGAEKAQQIRDSFYKALPSASVLGATMKDLAAAQQSYTNESGRAVALSGEQLINITAIGNGTGVGVQEASRLVAQFELLGMNTQKSQDIIQGIVDTTERMGVNSTKVLKNISTNFKELNKFAFRDGVKGMASMAAYAEKFKIDINESINSASMAKSLDGAITMASELAILGGEFAKADPFELLFLSRNDPAKYTQKLNEMTKGMASLTKTADGFKIDVNPQDLDRLELAAKATGQDFGTMVQQAQKFAEVQEMNKQLMGTAFSKQDRELIQSMAKLDSETGLFKVLGKDISKLSTQELQSLKVQQTTLKERAEASQTFEEKFNNTINAMKYTLIPILDGINSVFDTIHPYLKGIVDFMSKQPPWAKDVLKVVGGLAGAGVALGMAGNILKTIPGIGLLGKFFTSGKGIAGAAGSALGGGSGAGGAAAGGKGGFGAGAGVGAAAIGIGAGVGVAAVGISKLADSMSKLNKDQVDALKQIAITLAVSFPLAAIGIGILAAVAAPAAVPLLALGAAMLMIGGAVGIAAAGIGYMAQGFSTLLTSASPEKVFQLAAGIGALGLAMTSLAGGSVLTLFAGGGAFAMLGLLSTRADAFERIGKSMKEIGVVLNSDGEGLSRLKETLDSIQNSNTSGGIFGDLKELLSKPLKVEFKDKNVQLNVNMSLEVDSSVLAKKTAKKIIVLHNDYQTGKAG
jgi:hypothetical protein